jgi:hypothetical protein
MAELSPEVEKARPLAEDQLDFSLYLNEKYMESGPPETASVADFRNTAWELISRKRGNPIAVIEENRLRRWLIENRPKRLFFNPDELIVLASKRPKLSVEKVEEEGVTRWKFKLNPALFSEEYLQGQQVVLCRGEKHGFSSLPYFEVEFSAEYKKGKVIFKPKLSGGMLSGRMPAHELHEELLRLLGLKILVVQQELDVHIDRRKREAHFDLEAKWK